MVSRVGFSFVGMALTVLVAPSAWADVLPSKRVAKSAESARLTERLVATGMSGAEASARLSQLPREDLAYFAHDPGRVQVVAGLWFEEWAIALGFLGFLGLLTLIVVDDARNN